MKKVISVIMLVLLSTLAICARVDLKFKHIGLDQGLSHTTVTAIGQDENGYIWVGTPDGLNRYDGYTFQVYRNEADNQHSIASNEVRSLRFGADGSMWVALPGAIARYDRTSGRFSNYTPASFGDTEINDILPVDSLRMLVATTAGLFTFNLSDGSFSPGFGKTVFPYSVSFLSRSGNDVFVSAGSNGLKSLDLTTGRLSDIALSGHPVVGTALPARGSVFVATEGRGLQKVDLTTGVVKEFRAGGSEGLNSDYVRSLAFDGNGRLWVGTFNGLDILDTEQHKFTHYDTDPYSADALSHPSVRRIFADNQGGMWLGTFFGALNYCHPLRNQFQTMRHSPAHPSLNDNVIGSLYEDSSHNIWIATNNGGVNVYDPAHGSFRHYTVDNGLTSNDVKAIYADESAGRVYVGSHLGGLNIIDPRSGKVSRVAGTPENVYSILPAVQPGHFWLASIDNIIYFDTASGEAMPVSVSGLQHITDLYRDARGLLWVSGEDGVSAFNEAPGGHLTPAKSIPDEINSYRQRVNNVYMSRDGHTYYISTGRGLICFDSRNGAIKRYTTADGMPNDMVYGVLEDANGKLWCSSNGGLSLLNPADGSIISYNASDGLQSNQFRLNSFLRSSDGYMYFGGVNGLTFFNPSVLKSNPYAPAPLITGLRLFNHRVTPGDDTGLLDKDVTVTERISLAPGQSSLTIDFTVCNYVAAQHNAFSYMLEGFDKEWTVTDDVSRSVTYSNLPPGDYRFVLRAANNDGVWSSETTSLLINVQPRWYQRWWVRALFLLLIASLASVVVIYFWRRRERMRRLQIDELNRGREKELNEMKVRFFINMSHELRTPLTLILLPIQELMQRASDRKTVQRLNLVKNNAERMLRIVNQLLDYRRAEMGMFKLQTEPVDLNALVRKVFDNYEYQAARRGVRYTLDSTIADTPVMCDRQYIELICNNLISNAFKYTPRDHSISVSLTAAGTEASPCVRISVVDTGCGIPADKLPEIFTRFYKVDDRAGGSGIGLSLVKKLVELHHGNITVESRLGEGTAFTVEIPVGPNEYSSTERLGEASKLPVPPTETLPAPIALPEPEDDNVDEADKVDASATEEGRETVMVVDDNPDILKYICEYLAGSYNVLPAADGAKAVDILANNTVDLIITDIMMPDIDGVQLCRTVKRNLRTSHIPVIMLSAKNDVTDQLDGLKVGADDYIAKPFSLELLSRKIRNLLHTRRQTIRHFSDSPETKTEAPALNPLDEEFIKKAMAVMEKYLDNSEFTTDCFASEMCMSRSNLHLKMKALTGESTNEFIRRFRMRRAMELIKTGRYNISQVSAMVGYGTPSYFATSFKKFYGELPSSFIKND